MEHEFHSMKDKIYETGDEIHEKEEEIHETKDEIHITEVKTTKMEYNIPFMKVILDNYQLP